MKLDDVKKLHQKKYRQEMGHFLIEGEHLVLELAKAALKYPLLKDSIIYATENLVDLTTHFNTVLVTEKQMQQLSETKTPQGIIAVVPMQFRESTQAQREKAIFLNEIQDPGNLGTIFRTAAWFGHFKILLSPNSVDPFNGKTVRASMGAIFHVPFQQEVNVAHLKESYPRIASLGMKGQPIKSDNFSEFDCYLFGNEARGLNPTLLNFLAPVEFTIPGAGNIDSLNLATAVSLSCYELQK